MSVRFVNENTTGPKLAAQTIHDLRTGAGSVYWIGPRRVAGLMQAAAKMVAHHVPETTCIGTERYPAPVIHEVRRDGPDQAEISWHIDSDGSPHWLGH